MEELNKSLAKQRFLLAAKATTFVEVARSTLDRFETREGYRNPEVGYLFAASYAGHPDDLLRKEFLDRLNGILSGIVAPTTTTLDFRRVPIRIPADLGEPNPFEPEILLPCGNVLDHCKISLCQSS